MKGECLQQCNLQLVNTGNKDLSCKKSECLVSFDKRSRVVVEENKKKYELINDGDSVAVFQVDGGMITSKDEIKCDKLLLALNKKKAIFVELKGADLRHGMRQIENTIRMLERALVTYSFEGRVVTSRRTNVPQIHTDRQYVQLKKALKKKGGDLIVQSDKITDYLKDM